MKGSSWGPCATRQEERAAFRSLVLVQKVPSYETNPGSFRNVFSWKRSRNFTFWVRADFSLQVHWMNSVTTKFHSTQKPTMGPRLETVSLETK